MPRVDYVRQAVTVPKDAAHLLPHIRSITMERQQDASIIMDAATRRNHKLPKTRPVVSKIPSPRCLTVP